MERLTCACCSATQRRACQTAGNMPQPLQTAASMTGPAAAAPGSSGVGTTPWRGGWRPRICTGSCRNTPAIGRKTAADPSPRRSSMSGPARTRSPESPARGKVRTAERASGRRRTQAGRGRAGSPPVPPSPTPRAPAGRAHVPVRARCLVQSSRSSSPHQALLHLLTPCCNRVSPADSACTAPFAAENKVSAVSTLWQEGPHTNHKK